MLPRGDATKMAGWQKIVDAIVALDTDELPRVPPSTSGPLTQRACPAPRLLPPVPAAPANHLAHNLAAPSSDGAICRRRGDCLSAGVEGLVGDLWIVGPMGDQAPLQCGDLSHAVPVEA
jgi:hypothetical protein